VCIETTHVLSISISQTAQPLDQIHDFPGQAIFDQDDGRRSNIMQLLMLEEYCYRFQSRCDEVAVYHSWPGALHSKSRAGARATNVQYTTARPLCCGFLPITWHIPSDTIMIYILSAHRNQQDHPSWYPNSISYA
jgi:hypothetical protein